MVTMFTTLSIPFMGYKGTLIIYGNKLSSDFQFPLWDTHKKHQIIFTKDKIFQFPLWDTKIYGHNKYSCIIITFNSLYGIPSGLRHTGN